jgi:integrase
MTKKRIATGIYQDASGYEVRACLGSKKTELLETTERFPPSARLEDMIIWRDTEKLKLRKARGAGVTRGTVRAKIVTYLATAKLSDDNRTQRIRFFEWWCGQAGLGDVPWHTLDAPRLRRALNTLIAAGYAASTVNKCRDALAHVYTVLDGENAPNPFREIDREIEPEAEPRGVDYAIVDTILYFLRVKWRRSAKGQPSRLLPEKRPLPSLGAIRLRVLAYAPLTPAQLKLVQPKDLHLDDTPPNLLVRGRKKGKPGAVGFKRKPLLPLAVEAFRDFVAADAFGPFTRGSLRKTFIRARDLAQAELRKVNPNVDLSDMVPYDLRHSFGSLIFQLTGSDAVTGELLDHKNPVTTKRYRLAAVPAHLQAATDAAAAFLAARATPPLPDTTTRHFQKTTENQTILLRKSQYTKRHNQGRSGLRIAK